jgi:hypothetical protein
MTETEISARRAAGGPNGTRGKFDVVYIPPPHSMEDTISRETGHGGVRGSGGGRIKGRIGRQSPRGPACPGIFLVGFLKSIDNAYNIA